MSRYFAIVRRLVVVIIYLFIYCRLGAAFINMPDGHRVARSARTDPVFGKTLRRVPVMFVRGPVLSCEKSKQTPIFTPVPRFRVAFVCIDILCGQRSRTQRDRKNTARGRNRASGGTWLSRVASCRRLLHVRAALRRPPYLAFRRLSFHRDLYPARCPESVERSEKKTMAKTMVMMMNMIMNMRNSHRGLLVCRSLACI